jgi:dihydrofolate reductase
MIPFSIIVAVDAKFGIGKEGNLPWHLPEDLKHFKVITTKTSDPSKKNVVIMGRKTWESLPEQFRPLPRRINVVLSRDESLKLPKDVYKAVDFSQVVQLLQEKAFLETIDQVFVIGGGQIFKEALDMSECQRLFLTHIQYDFGCDAFFPSIPKGYKEVSRTSQLSFQGISYYFAEYQK